MIRAFAAGALLVGAATAAAQTPEPQPAPEPVADTAPCELHVWPAPELKAVTQGWVWNHTVDQAFEEGMAKPETFTPASQAKMLAELDLPKILELKPSTVTIHPDPLPRSAGSAKLRHAASASPCYAELIVSQLFYDEAPLAGASLRMLFVLRDFGAAPVPASSFSTWAASGLADFPPKDAAGQKAAAATLANAYRSNVGLFGRYATEPKPIKKSRKKR